jgi:peptide/nickel transport system substrate-binding protein
MTMKPFISARRSAALAAALAIGMASSAAALAGSYIETPMLEAQVKDGKLPPVMKRLPDKPLVEKMEGAGRSIGRHGGEMRMLMAGSKDVRMMVVYGYARLVRYNEKLELEPDIVEKLDVEDGRVFTFHLRKGHRWSDGHPFTAEDFRYFWEDVANNDKLTPTGIPAQLLAAGEKPSFQVIDAHTVRYSWPKPNPAFLAHLAGASPLYIYRPAHYLKRFHEKYSDPVALQRAAKAAGQRSWAPWHNLMDNQYKNDNVELPQLDPWINTTPTPSDRFVFVRNPYFHRVDAEGRQLPYVDKVIMSVAASNIIPAKTGAGESDLQARYLRFDNYTFLRSAQKTQNFDTRLWSTGIGSQVALYPNLNAKDPVWRALNRDVRYRRALSLAINRHEINQVIYFGLAIEGQNTLLPQSPLYAKSYADAWAKYDPAEANRLLDELGLTKRDGRGFRLLPDGRVLEVIVETAGESTEQVDVLELIRDSWAQAGIKLFTKPSQREVFRNRVFAGDTVMAAWGGIDNALATPGMPPDEFTPVRQDRLMWPKWGQFYETKGKSGEAPDMKWGQELMKLHDEWYNARKSEDLTRIWRRILEINAEEVTSIGVVSAVPQPVVASLRLRNLPQKGMFSWEPGAHFGIYRLDTLWFDGPARTAAADAQPPRR